MRLLVADECGSMYNIVAPLEGIALNVAGHSPVTDSGNKYILVIMAYFSKPPESFAIPKQEVVTVAKL